MQCIMAAIDQSADAIWVLRRTRLLAAESSARIVIMHIVKEASAAAESSPLSVQRRKIDQLLQEAGQDPESCTIEVVPGNLAEALAQASAQHKPDIILLGALHSARFEGSIGEAVLRQTHRPLLFVKMQPTASYRKLLVATDFSKPARHALALSLHLFPQAEISVAHAYSPPFQGFLHGDDVRAHAEAEHRKILEELIGRTLDDAPAEERRSIKLILAEGMAEKVVPQLSDELDSDLVVFGTHGRTGLRAALLGSIAASLLMTVTRDTLLIGPER